MLLRVAGYSDRGTERAQNEDFYCIGPFVEQGVLTTLTLETASAVFTQYGLLAAVADGMGGYPGGEVASRIVLETLSALYYGERRTGCTREELAACLARYLAATQQALAGILERTPELHSAGTTLAGVALMPPDALVIFHIGDSEVLREAAGYVRQLTVSHTPTGEDVASGRMSEAEAAVHPTASQLTRALGLLGDTRVELDAAQPWMPETRFLLGTDGWHGPGRGIGRPAIQEALRHGGTAAQLVPALVAEAVRQDGQDNATLVMVETTAQQAGV